MLSRSASYIHLVLWAIISAKTKSCRIVHHSLFSHRRAEVMARTPRSEQESFKITFLCCTTTTHKIEFACFQLLGRDNKSEETRIQILRSAHLCSSCLSLLSKQHLSY